VAWRVVPTPELLRLHQRLASFEAYRRRPQPEFTPHLTIAFDDLDADGADALERETRLAPELFPESLSWCCDNMCLYRLDRERWRCHHAYRADGSGDRHGP